MNRPPPVLIDLRYHLACLHPFRSHIRVRRAPLGLQFKAHKRDVIGRLLYKQGVHEPALTAWMIDRFGGTARPLHFVDIGANIGYFSCLLSRLAGSEGSVVAIEPEPHNQAMLRANLALNDICNVRLEPVALGATDGTATLHRYKQSNQGRHSIVGADGGGGDIEVPVRRLDDLLAAAPDGPVDIDLIKIDVEGYEPFALEGAAHALQRTKVLALEFSPALIGRTSVDPGDFLRRTMASFDRLSAVTPEGVRPCAIDDCLRTLDQTDLIFERGD